MTESTTTLGAFLSKLRSGLGLSLRAVQERSGVSNAYISQIETGKIATPSPNVLRELAAVYGVPYEDLMQRAGYLTAKPAGKSKRRKGHVAASALEGLTEDEQEQVLEFIAFLRSKRKKG